MELHTFLSVILGLVFLMFLFVIVAWVIVEWGIRQEKNESVYNTMYSTIQIDIRKAKITQANFDMIYDKIERLSKLPHKNRERTILLDVEFRTKFNELEDEFSPESIFAGE